MSADNDLYMANKAYLSQVSTHDIAITYDSHTARLSHRYFGRVPTLNLLPPPGGDVDEDAALARLDAVAAGGGRIFLDPRAWCPDRVTRVTSRFFDARLAQRYPELLRTIVARYDTSLVWVPLVVAETDEPPPLVTPR